MYNHNFLYLQDRSSEAEVATSREEEVYISTNSEFISTEYRYFNISAGAEYSAVDIHRRINLVDFAIVKVKHLFDSLRGVLYDGIGYRAFCCLPLTLHTTKHKRISTNICGISKINNLSGNIPAQYLQQQVTKIAVCRVASRSIYQ